MILFPAVDLKGGECVRLKLGDMAQATVYNADPAAQARAFEEQGFEYLHVVDLDGAFAGEAVNGAAVEAILDAVSIPVQLGGGIRTMEHVEYWLDKGIARVILGTIAVRDPGLVREACERFPDRIVVGIDAKGGKVAVEGWAETSELTAIGLAKRFEDAGVAAIIHTDIDRDGVLKGINWEATLELALGVDIPVIASGGLASMNDIRRMTKEDAQLLEGVISGRALYDGRIDAEEALMLLEAGRAAAIERKRTELRLMPWWPIFLGTFICLLFSIWPLIYWQVMQFLVYLADCTPISPIEARDCWFWGMNIGEAALASGLAGFLLPYSLIPGLAGLFIWLTVGFFSRWRAKIQ